MERLTEPTIDCFKYGLKDHKAVVGEFGNYEAFFDYSIAVKRLGEYEDTGLEPEEIIKMRGEVKTAYDENGEAYATEFTGYEAQHITELVQAEQDGRLVVLPCKVGDVLYSFFNYPQAKIYSFCVIGMSITNGTMSICTDRLGIFPASHIGKVVFLTREEAEKALGDGRNDGYC